MALAALNITNTDLLSKLRASFIGDPQKQELEELIPEMNSGEKSELLGLIQRSNQEAGDMELEYQQKLKALNEEYQGRMSKMVREGNDYSRKELERLEEGKKAETMRILEGEVASVSNSLKKTAASEDRHQTHAFRNTLVLILVLGFLAGGMLAALNYLS